MTLTDFLLARIAEDEALALGRVNAPEWHGVDAWGEETVDFVLGNDGPCDPARVLAECGAKRRIIAFHESWPVMVERPPTFEQVGSDPQSMTFRATQQIAWLTQEEYRTRFGDEPPTAPMLLALAQPYADHPDFDPAWRAEVGA